MNEKIVVQHYKIKGKDYQSAGVVSEEIKGILEKMQFDREVIRRACICVFEAEMNVVMYAEKGVIDLVVTPEKIGIVVRDKGQGIENIELALQEGYSTASDQIREMGFGAGMGLPNIERNSDQFEISSEVGKGTRLNIVLNANSSLVH